jgi:endonuclease YncB( thermonuclease family)
MPFSIHLSLRFPGSSLCGLLTLSPAAAISEYHDLVVRVLDGDTLEVAPSPIKNLYTISNGTLV